MGFTVELLPVVLCPTRRLNIVEICFKLCEIVATMSISSKWL